MSGLLLAANRKALHDHTIIDKYVAGVVLKGYEVKALREKNVSFEGAYIQILGRVPVLVNLHIGEYSKQSNKKGGFAESPRRSRNLLLNKKEIMDIDRKLKTKGITAVPLALLVQHNLVKLEFAVVKGKKEFEKKQVTKERQMDRDMQIEFKDFHRSVDV
jgi:SsrA-binding protein